MPVEALATEDSTELATPPDAGSAAAVPLKTVYAATTFFDLGLYTGLHHANPRQSSQRGHAVTMTSCTACPRSASLRHLSSCRHFAGHGTLGVGLYTCQPEEMLVQGAQQSASTPA